MDQASRNAQDAISLIQTAEGAMSTTHNILQRMRELAVQSANDTSTDGDRQQLQKEINQLKSEVDRVAYTTEFNTKKLLNGSLTATKELQGTKANSAKVDAADLAATAGTATGGQAISERGVVQTVTGKGATETAFNALDEKIKIFTGVNDTFNFDVSGVTFSTSGVIAASTGDGYTRAQFATAVQEAINSVLKTDGLNTEKNQILVSLTADNKLKFTTAETGVEANFSILAASGDNSALSAIGFKGYQNTYESTIDLSLGYTVSNSGHNGSFTVKIGGVSGSIDLASGAVYSKTSLITEIQTQLDDLFGAGVAKIGDADGDGKLELSTLAKTASFAISSGAVSTGLGASGIFGIAAGAQASGGIINSGTTVSTKGTNSVMGYSNGINIAAGVNDQFNISVDGGTAETLILSTKLYATKSDLVNEINNQIGSNTALSGKVQAQLTSDNNIEFASVKTGSASSVTVTAPPSLDQSALGALGYGPSVGIISGSVDISNGIRFSGESNSSEHWKMNIVLGNKAATINLLDQANIITNGLGAATSGVTTRDAIVKGMQAELDKAFGAGALNVSTKVSGSVETLRITTITAATKFSIGSAAGYSGAALIFNASLTSGQGVSGILGATPTNAQTTGTDAIEKSLATNTLLSQLTDKDNNNLALNAGNVITFAGTQNGAEFKASLTVTADSTVGDLLGAVRSVPAFQGASVALDIANGSINITGKDGEKFDLSNLRFQAQKSVTDTTAIGNFNRTFGSFETTQKAQDAASDASLTMQIGANQGQTVAVDINNVDANSLKIANIDVSTKDGAQSAISVVNNALEFVSEERSKLGAIQNRLEHTISNLGTSSENLTASESRIRDVDMAKEMMEFTKNNILSQAAQAMLAQANQQPQGVLQLLR
ncbi:MAG: flagellin [Paenibacillus sp.]|nr:flagellin [Paenibacillus sp.]